MFWVVLEYSCSKWKVKKYKQNTLLKSYKSGIKLLVNPGFAYGGLKEFQ